MIKMQPEMSEQMKINHFHSLLKKGALQTFKNISTTNIQTLEDALVIFRRKYVKPESQASSKHKWHRLVLDLNTMKLPVFLDELNQVAKKCFGITLRKWLTVSFTQKCHWNWKIRQHSQTTKGFLWWNCRPSWKGIRTQQRSPMTYQWHHWLPQQLSLKPFSPLGKPPTLSATTAKKRAILSKTARNWKRRKRKLPNKANLLRGRHIPNAGLVASFTTLKKDAGRVQEHI